MIEYFNKNRNRIKYFKLNYLKSRAFFLVAYIFRLKKQTNKVTSKSM